MKRLIKTIQLLLAIFNLWKTPATKENPIAKNDPPRPEERDAWVAARKDALARLKSHQFPA